MEEPLKSFEEQFGDRFLRIHRNALVARNRLIALEKGADGESLACHTGTNERLQIRRRHLPKIRQWLKSGGQ